MNPKSLPTIITTLVILTLSLHINITFCQNNPQYETCRQPLQCGGFSDLRYPFSGGNRPPYCGHPGFELTCSSQNDNTLLINISSQPYRILEIDSSSNTMKIARQDLYNALCPTTLTNTTLNFTLFDYMSDSNDQNITLFYGCTITVPQATPPPYRFTCGTDRLGFYLTQATTGFNTIFSCENRVLVPVSTDSALRLSVPDSSNPAVLQGAIQGGFWVEWSAEDGECDDCMKSGGACGYDRNSTSFACYCEDQTYPLTCNNTRNAGNAAGNDSNKTGMQIGFSIAGAVVAGIGIGWLIFCCKQRRKKQLVANSNSQTMSKEITAPLSSKSLLSTQDSANFTQSVPSYPSSKSDFGRSTSYFGVQVFNYTELEEATNNFDPARELGDGGFGTVYKGVLSDGRVVAVKRLYENNFKRVEQFMNEVEILTRLRHDNLVLLHGCTSKRSRELLLVYEYISNGTVADHLNGKRAKSGLLSWPVRLKIAIETADALAYLHKSDIIHRDVKTNNILLDNDFHVKVADFGLSRLFPTDVTHVSTAPQGTPGYVDPEYYQCYQLTEKSDVYSFGVVLIELISSLPAVDTSRHRLDINLANMAINKIQNRTLNELVDSSLGFESNNVVRRMVTLVAELAFRCLQHERDMRPSMGEVLEGLRGIQNEDLNSHKVEIVDMSVDEDDSVLLKGDSGFTDKWASGSTRNSSE